MGGSESSARHGEPTPTRRGFFGWVGAAGAMAAAAASGCTPAGPSKAEAARAGTRLPPVTGGRVPARSSVTIPGSSSAEPLGIPGLSPYYLPNRDFYRIDINVDAPRIDPAGWSLQVDGMVDRPFSLSFAELLALSGTAEAVTLSCVSNPVGGSLIGNALWQGVPLRTLLTRAGVRSGATQIVGTSSDGFSAGFPTDVALDGRAAMVAVGMNGEPLPFEHGWPARLVVAGLYGYVSATKWLTRLTLTRWEDFDGYWVRDPHRWAKRAPMKLQSRIDVPRAGGVPAGAPAKIAGVAWAPSVGVAKVEVQVDGGPWTAATLAPAISDDSWVQWHRDWIPAAGAHTLRCRATDRNGTLQPGIDVAPFPDGAEGWHTVTVTSP